MKKRNILKIVVCIIIFSRWELSCEYLNDEKQKCSIIGSLHILYKNREWCKIDLL